MGRVARGYDAIACRAQAGSGVGNFLVEEPRFRRGTAPRGEQQDAHDPHVPAKRQGQDIAGPKAGVRLVRRLAIDPDQAAGHETGAVGARLHEAGAPQPLVEPLPVAVLAQRRNAPSAANGPS